MAGLVLKRSVKRKASILCCAGYKETAVSDIMEQAVPRLIDPYILAAAIEIKRREVYR